MSNTIPGQIISELGEIGKTVGSEVAKTPVDIAGKAMESLGVSSGGKTPAAHPAGEKAEPSAWERIDTEQDEAVKRAFARKALEELAGGMARPKEPSIWERLQQEAEQKKQMAAYQAAAAQAAQLPKTPSKRPAGDLYGMKAKKQGSEVGKNVRQD